jgi:hypothetical protein
MMTQDRDYEDILRRALTAAAESIEPGGDGLQRIRHRLDSRRSPRSVFSRFAEWLDLHGTRLLVRLDPLIEGARGVLRRTGPLSGPLLALASFLGRLFSPRGRRRAGGHRGQASPPGRLGPAGAWLRPVLAVSAAVAIVVVGVVILNHETGTLINPANNNIGTTSPGASLSGSGTTANSKRWKLPLGVTPAPTTGTDQRNYVPSAPALPAVACTPTPKPAVTTSGPSGGPTGTPTPTPSGSVTGTPTPTPSGSVTGTPTPTSPATSGTATAPAAMVLPYDAGDPAVVECGTTSATTSTTSPKPSQTP